MGVVLENYRLCIGKAALPGGLSDLETCSFSWERLKEQRKHKVGVITSNIMELAFLTPEM